MRSMWKGAISFGLVMIPVRLYAATEQKDIAFRQVHREDGGRIRFRRVCSIDGAEVPYEDVAKGYELPDGEMIVLTDEDMADLPLATSKSIEVMHFAPADQLDPILFSRSYYVEPENTGVRAYALLRDALERSGQDRHRPGRPAPARVAGHAAHPRRGAGAGDAAVARRGPGGRLPVPGRRHRGALPGTADGQLPDRLHDRRLRSRRVPRPVPGGAPGAGGGQGRGPRGGPAPGRGGGRRADQPGRRAAGQPGRLARRWRRGEGGRSPRPNGPRPPVDRARQIGPAPASSKDDAQPGGRGKAAAGSRRTAKADADDEAPARPPGRAGAGRPRPSSRPRPAGRASGPAEAISRPGSVATGE